MRYFVRVETKKNVLYLYVINNNTPSLAVNWKDATFFRTIEEMDLVWFVRISQDLALFL